MIGPWLETQPERVRSVLDPSWSPVRAAVVLAARHEQEEIASLDAFFGEEHGLARAVAFGLDEDFAKARTRICLLEAELASYENPTCNGEWVGGSGGHRKFSGCGLPATWRDDGGACFCDHHLPQNERIAQLEAELETARSEVSMYRTRKDQAFTERNSLVALLAYLTVAAGLNAGKRQHEDVPGEEWDPEWRTLVAIDLPTGQVSWHFHDRDSHLVSDLPEYSGKWDGHDTEEKYRRVANLSANLAAMCPGIADLATARAAMGPLGDPPMPEPCECNWPDACACGADENRPLPERFLFGVPPEHQPPPHHTEIPFPLPNDPRLP